MMDFFKHAAHTDKMAEQRIIDILPVSMIEAHLLRTAIDCLVPTQRFFLQIDVRILRERAQHM